MTRTKPLIGFFGAPFTDKLDLLEADFAFLGVPYGSPYDMGGVRSPASGAPMAVRQAAYDFEYHEVCDHWDFDLERQLVPDGVRIAECGDVIGDPRDLALAPRQTVAAVASIVEAGALPLIVGGDDAVPPIVSAGLTSCGTIHVLQIDAHLDFREDVGGVRDGFSSPIRRLRDQEWVGRIVQLGLRGVGSARHVEVQAARAAGNTLITARELHEAGPEAILSNLPEDAPFFVTVDCDGLDPAIAPGVGFPEPDGVTFREAATIVRALAGAGRIAAIAFTEFRPAYDVRQLTALTIVRLFSSVISLTPSREVPASATGVVTGSETT